MSQLRTKEVVSPVISIPKLLAFYNQHQDKRFSHQSPKIFPHCLWNRLKICLFRCLWLLQPSRVLVDTKDLPFLIFPFIPLLFLFFTFFFFYPWSALIIQSIDFTMHSWIDCTAMLLPQETACTRALFDLSKVFPKVNQWLLHLVSCFSLGEAGDVLLLK